VHIASFLLALLLPGNIAAQIDHLVSDALARSRTPAFSVAVLQRGRIVFAKGYGKRNLKSHSPADADTRYAIGSITKEFTAALILQLISEKCLHQNTLVEQFFPGFDRHIRIADLLRQTSGLPDYNTAEFIARSFPAEMPGHVRTDAVIREIGRLPLHFQPGSKFEYSNSNYFLLGFVAERVAGKPLATLFRDRIFAPLKMNSTGLDTGLGPDEAQGYTLTDAGPVPIPQFDSHLTLAAGGLRSSASDLALWNGALLKVPRFHRLLKEMTAPVDLSTGRSPYGAGLFAYPYGMQTVGWHDGTVAGYKAMDVLAFPSDVAVIALANADTAPSPILAWQIRALLLPLDGAPDVSLLNAQPTWWSRAIAGLTLLIAIAAGAALARHFWRRPSSL